MSPPPPPQKARTGRTLTAAGATRVPAPPNCRHAGYGSLGQQAGRPPGSQALAPPTGQLEDMVRAEWLSETRVDLAEEGVESFEECVSAPCHSLIRVRGRVRVRVRARVMGVVTVQGGGVANVLSQSTHTTLNGRRDKYEAARITWLGLGSGLG